MSASHPSTATICEHGRQLGICAVCAPAADAAYRALHPADSLGGTPMPTQRETDYLLAHELCATAEWISSISPESVHVMRVLEAVMQLRGRRHSRPSAESVEQLIRNDPWAAAIAAHVLAARSPAPTCDCGAPAATSCVGCLQGEYQAAHPDCASCCPPAAPSDDQPSKVHLVYGLDGIPRYEPTQTIPMPSAERCRECFIPLSAGATTIPASMVVDNTSDRVEIPAAPILEEREADTVLREIEVDALRVLAAFCHEKHVGYGGWYAEHAVAAKVLDAVIARRSRPLEDPEEKTDG